MLKPHLRKMNSMVFKGVVVMEYWRMAKPVTSMAKIIQKSTKKAVADENYHTTSHKLLRLMLIANNHPIYP